MYTTIVARAVAEGILSEGVERGGLSSRKGGGGKVH